MAAKTTLNAKNLESLGAGRLAELLLELATGNAAAKRKLRLALAGEASPRELAVQVRKRLVSIGKAKSFIDWQKRKVFTDELDTQRRAISRLAAADPKEALELAWQLLALAPGVYRRTDDGNGAIDAVFTATVADLGAIAAAARLQPEALAETVFRAVQVNDYGQYAGLIEALAPVLGPAGLGRLKARLVAWSKEKLSGADRDGIASGRRDETVRRALRTIAELEGDLDAYIAQYDERVRATPGIATDIARRLLAAGRVEAAWAAIEAPSRRKPPEGARAGKRTRDLDDLLTLVAERPLVAEVAWEETRVEVLDAMGRSEEAQAYRLACFERALEPRHLKAYLKRLPDFDDIAAEEKALAHAAAFPDVHRALVFLVEWHALAKAAAMVLARRSELDGNIYEVLGPAAEALAERHPLAASLCLRAMIDFALSEGRSSRYGHAARHLSTCAALAPAIADFGAVETHAAFAARLLAKHGRKHGFWGLVG